ncbi:MAG: hypothetical protein AAF726_15370 [Planctomycetota bacterium]
MPPPPVGTALVAGQTRPFPTGSVPMFTGPCVTRRTFIELDRGALHFPQLEELVGRRVDLVDQLEVQLARDPGKLGGRCVGVLLFERDPLDRARGCGRGSLRGSTLRGDGLHPRLGYGNAARRDEVSEIRIGLLLSIGGPLRGDVGAALLNRRGLGVEYEPGQDQRRDHGHAREREGVRSVSFGECHGNRDGVVESPASRRTPSM